MAQPLPEPDSDELAELVPTALHQAIYEALYEARDDPPTMKEAQAFVRGKLGDEAADQVHFSKRLRELRDHFVIPSATAANGYTYKLAGRRTVSKADPKITKTVRAEVLKNQRCDMCGQSPAEDGVRLHVDHKIPREWGGTSDIDNLQALCSDCNEGKKAYFSTFDQHADKIRAAIQDDEPHKRIGELLKSFQPEEIRSDLIELVASAQQYQEDWQKRLRELRELDWKITPRKQKDEVGRVRVYWRLDSFEPWPTGKVAAEIKRREKAKKAAKKNP